MASLQSRRYQRFVARLRAARQDAGMTQVQVARALHEPQSFVSKSERAERRVDAVELADFARVYKKPLEYFVT